MSAVATQPASVPAKLVTATDAAVSPPPPPATVSSRRVLQLCAGTAEQDAKGHQRT
jgi:hypothetical protein